MAGVILAGIFLVGPLSEFGADLVHPPRIKGLFKKKSVRTARSRALEGSMAMYYWIFSIGSVLVMAWRRLPEWEEEPASPEAKMFDDPVASAETILSDAGAETVASTDGIVAAGRTSVVLPSSERYKVEGEIGRGGMGIVYRASDTLLNRPVALKSLSGARSGDGAAVERFVREAQALAQLTHPCIVQVYDLTEFDGELYMAMELVVGKDLAELLEERGSFTLSESLELGTSIAGALAYAHGRGVVHRDYKPANVLLGEDGVPKVMDFGLAKIAREPSMTIQGMVMGSPNYMSPEQASGSQTDARTDIYSFGITLFEMIGGVPPFTGEPMQVMMQHISQPHPDLRDQVAGVPDALVALIDRMLAKDPQKRIGTMEEVATALKEISMAENA